MRKSQVRAVVCSALLIVPAVPTFAWQIPASPPAQSASPQTQGPQLPADQLDSLVAPVALYPDPILGQVLVASTYPLEIAEASQWMSQNSSLSGQTLIDAAAKQSWDASVQALVSMPDVLHRLATDIRWTTDLGDAFLAQQQDVMAAIQRMRAKAQQNGALQSNTQQTVGTTASNGQTYITIEPAQPQTVYVPEYNPEAVYGAAAYPYPAIGYPSAFSFGAGFFVGALWGGGWGGWGWGCGWGGGHVIINNNFINRNHFNHVNTANGNHWVHNPGGRGAASRLGPGERGGRPGEGPGRGGANRIGPNAGRGEGGRPGTPGQGGANRMAPGARPGGERPVMPSHGGANRMAPGMHGGGFHGGGFHGGGGGFRGGGGFHGGGHGGGRR